VTPAAIRHGDRAALAYPFVTFVPKPDGAIEKNGSSFARGRFQFRLLPAVHAGFERLGPEICNAGTDSKQLEELTACKPGGSDSPKLRTASTRSGGT
jgi:hypothetical protein